MKMPEDFLLKISKLGSNFDSVADTVLQAGGEVVLKRVKSNLSSVIGRGTKFKSRATGELEGALGLSPSKLNRDGNHDIKVGFAEPRSDGGSNAKLANILEYGCKTVSEARENGVPTGMHRRHDQGTGRGGGKAVSLLSDLQTIAEHCGVPVETGVFSSKAPDTYLVITPLSDR